MAIDINFPLYTRLVSGYFLSLCMTTNGTNQKERFLFHTFHKLHQSSLEKFGAYGNGMQRYFKINTYVLPPWFQKTNVESTPIKICECFLRKHIAFDTRGFWAFISEIMSILAYLYGDKYMSLTTRSVKTEQKLLFGHKANIQSGTSPVPIL